MTTFFGRIFNWPLVNLSATAVVSAAGGVPQPLNVAFILDTTASMSGSAENAAVAGVQTLLGELLPCASQTSCGTATNGNVANPVDEVALFVFPPVTNAAQATTDISCTNPQISPTYSGVDGISQASTTATLNLSSTTTASVAVVTGSISVKTLTVTVVTSGALAVGDALRVRVPVRTSQQGRRSRDWERAPAARARTPSRPVRRSPAGRSPAA